MAGETKMLEFSARDVLAECARIMKDPARATAEEVRKTYVHWIALGVAWKTALACAAMDGNAAVVEEAVEGVSKQIAERFGLDRGEGSVQ
jgi:hypothetical protein